MLLIDFGLLLLVPALVILFRVLDRKEWVGLTDEERIALWWSLDWNGMPEHEYGKAIEAKLKEKNT